DDELQELRELVTQLRADNLRLRQEPPPMSSPGPSSDSSSMSRLPGLPSRSNEVSGTLAERSVFIPRDRKCHNFNGRSGIGVTEWVEEVQACMRARHLSVSDQAFFLFDHLEGEARDEIRYRPAQERDDPTKIIAAFKELYGCSQSYIALQEAFFSRRQQEGETLLEFSLALMGLLEKVKQQSPSVMSNAEVLLRDQFVEHVLDGTLQRELKQLVRRQPTATLLDVRSEAIRWEREGMPGGARGRSHSVPVAHGFQYGVQSDTCSPREKSQWSEMSELRELLKLQQEQLVQLTKSVTQLRELPPGMRSVRNDFVICRRCQKPGHFARECREERVPPRPPRLDRTDTRASDDGQLLPHQASEN
ncbi:hypothetical protein IRJ41_016578, partial [Triplophysa rosa]